VIINVQALRLNVWTHLTIELLTKPIRNPQQLIVNWYTAYIRDTIDIWVVKRLIYTCPQDLVKCSQLDCCSSHGNARERNVILRELMIWLRLVFTHSLKVIVSCHCLQLRKIFKVLASSGLCAECFYVASLGRNTECFAS